MREIVLRYRRRLLFFFLFTLLYLIASQLALYIVPFIIALLFAVVMKPLYDFLKERFSFQPAFSATSLTLLIFGALLSVIGFLLYLIIRQAVSLFISYKDFIRDWLNLPQLTQQVRDRLISGDLLGRLSSFAAALFRFIPLIIIFFVITFAMTVFLLNHLSKIRQGILNKSPDRYKKTLSAVLFTANLTARRFIRSYMILYLITFIEAVFIFYLTGVPYPLPFAFVTAVADILPILGPGSVYVPFAAIFFLRGNYAAGIALLVFFLLTSILRQIIEPKIVSDNVKIHPLVVMAAIYFSVVSMNILVLFYVILLFLSDRILLNAGVYDEKSADPDKS